MFNRVVPHVKNDKERKTRQNPTKVTCRLIFIRKALFLVVTYQVYVLTGDLASSSTTADVRINIFGEYGDSGERTLIKSKTSNMPFQRGQVRVISYMQGPCKK